ncbi:MAG: hypothetical protein H0V63_07675 [Burkholderiaceae bacterium]|nr:hypothetical protein [Burkholderiaceae bacterium]
MTGIVRTPLRIRITLDDGIASYFRALRASPFGIYGSEQATAIYLIREGLISRFEQPIYRDAMMPHLPDDIQKAWGVRV